VDALPDATRAALAPYLDASEHVERFVAAVGCSLVLTDRRLAVVREGASYRPRSGVRSWTLDRSLSLHLAPARRETARLVIERTGRSASVFVAGEHVEEARTLIAEIRSRTYADS
jgi:hypothetical protein